MTASRTLSTLKKARSMADAAAAYWAAFLVALHKPATIEAFQAALADLIFLALIQRGRVTSHELWFDYHACGMLHTACEMAGIDDGPRCGFPSKTMTKLSLDDDELPFCGWKLADHLQ